MVPSTPGAFKQSRPTPFTPKRPLSAASTSSSSSDLSGRIARATATPSLLSSTHKKYKAPLSVESRSKISSKPKSVLPPVPGTPTKRDGTTSRPRTPVTPRKETDSPLLMPLNSEMDVSNVDPEQVLVDFETVEPGDISGEIDETWLRATESNHGKEDKVMVSIR